MITKLAVLSDTKQGIIGIRDEWKWLGFLIHISPSINKRACQALINAGALDYFKISRKRMIFEYGLFQELSKKEVQWVVDNIHEFKLKLEDVLINMASLPIGRIGACSNKNRHKKLLGLIESIQNPPYELVDKIHQIAQLEHQLMGISLTANSLHDCKGALKADCSCLEFDSGRRISATLAVKIERVKTHLIKRGLNTGQEMAFLTVSDNSGMLDTVVIFSDAWKAHGNIVEEGNRLLLTGKKSRDKDSFIVENVEQLS
jgi:DNA polymerase III alpha subunit